MAETQCVRKAAAKAKENGQKKFSIGEPCYRGHVSERYSACGSCISCVIENCAKYRKNDPEKRRKHDRAYEERKRSGSKPLARVRTEEEKAEALRKTKILNANRWARYDAKKKKATPKWADLLAIAEIYALSTRLKEETGIPHHVDHIIPIQGRNVCGLHVHYNLRAIPASVNFRKSNKLFEDI